MVFFLDCVQVRVGKSRRKESPENDWLPRGGGGFPELGDPPPPQDRCQTTTTLYGSGWHRPRRARTSCLWGRSYFLFFAWKSRNRRSLRA